MTPEDNLEKYFKKVLNDSQLSEEDWAMPSEDIWESAKVHFPKKKKKDRVAYIWWGLGLLVLGVSLGVTFFFSTAEEKKEAIVTTIDKTEKEQIIQKEIATAQNTIELTVNENEETAKHENKEQVSDTSQKTIPTPIENSRTTSIPKASSIISTKTSIINNSNQQPVFIESPLSNGIDKKMATSSLPTEIVPVAKTSSNKVKSVAVLPTLNYTIPSLEIAQRDLELPIASPMIVTPAPATFSKWEVGISYAPFVIIQESILNNGAASIYEEQTIGVKHQNINASIRRYVSPRLSVSSGLYLSKGTIDLRFCDKAIYEENTSSNLRYFLNSRSTEQNLNLSDLGLDIEESIVYSPDANLSNGDELTVKVSIPFKIKFVQIPLLLNWHFGKGKIKGIVHSGLSFDYQQVQAANLDFALFKGNQNIVEPITVDPLNEKTFKARWQAGTGIRYQITNHFQVGAGLHVNITEPILSRYDFGLYYGF